MLSIVIPVFNNYNFTKAALTDLIKLEIEHEIIVVNNGSTDGTEGFIKKSFPKVKCITFKTNQGFSKSCNRGWKESSGDYVMFLNNDIRVKSNHTNWPTSLIKGAKDDAIVGPTGGLLTETFEFIKETNKIEDGNFYMSGWNLTAHRDVWKKLEIINDQIWNERFSPAFFEDADLSFRAKKLGIPFKIVDVPVVHFGHMTAKKMNISAMYTKSKKLFTEIWANVKNN